MSKRKAPGGSNAPPTLPSRRNLPCPTPIQMTTIYTGDEGCHSRSLLPPNQNTRQSGPGAPRDGAGRGRGPAATSRRGELGRCWGLRPRPLTSSSCCRRRRPAGGWPDGTGPLPQRRHSSPWWLGPGHGPEADRQDQPRGRASGKELAYSRPFSGQGRRSLGLLCSSRAVEPGMGRWSLGGAGPAVSPRPAWGAGQVVVGGAMG